ncbi:MAG: hypothetical protein AB7Y46_15400 [Armatimonadota bacterium]
MKLSGWTVAVVVLALVVGAPWSQAGVEELRVTADFRDMPLRGALAIFEQAIPAEFSADIWIRNPELPLLDVTLTDVPLTDAINAVAQAYDLHVEEGEGRFLDLRQGGRPAKVPALSLERQWQGPTTVPELVAHVAAASGPDRLDGREREGAVAAVARLVLIGAPEGVTALRDLLLAPDADPMLKQQALVGLGVMGTPEALEAIREFEAWAVARYTDPATFRPDRGFKTIVASCRDEQGIEWTVFRWRAFIETDYWITRLMADGTWQRPIVLDIGQGSFLFRRDGRHQLSRVDGQFVLRTEMPFRLEQFETDADGDGLPNLVEQRMGTRDNEADTDGDGVPDGIDSNPRTPKHQVTDLTEIRQAVFACAYAVAYDQRALWVVERGDFANQEYYGRAGPVLRLREIREGVANLTGIQVEQTGPSVAHALIGEFTGGTAAWECSASLRKREGKWTVVRFDLDSIS